jgi:single-stranded-DNA-specific exonuclease
MRWRILSSPKSKTPKNRLQEIIKILLKNRGLKTKKEQKEFFHPQKPSSLSAKDIGLSPANLKKALTRIKKAIKNQEKIIIFGDFDADGICATAILWEALFTNNKNSLPFIPDRLKEGYGLSEKAIKTLLSTKPYTLDPKPSLIITVDSGITANRAVEFARQKKIDVIISDHHEKPRQLPKAHAIVHTTSLSGAGIAWFLGKTLNPKPKTANPLELAAIGTIADIMSLLGPNRSLVKYGLESLKKTKRIGLQELIQEAALDPQKIGTYEIGFIIAPRLNAMGRMESALDSLRLLCTQNRHRAQILSKKLGQTNRERQTLTEETLLKAKDILGSAVNTVPKSPKLVFVHHQEFQQGIIGLVASRLVEEFYLPSIVVSKGEIYSKASARSINGFNIIEALRECQDLLVDVGGHPMAAGFTIETKHLDTLKDRLQEVAQKSIDKKLLKKTIRVDCEIFPADITWSLHQKLENFAPFGLGNPTPTFSSKKVIVVDVYPVGSENQHLKLRLKDKNSPFSFSALFFGKGELAAQIAPGNQIDLVYTIEANIWNNEKNLELKIKDLRFLSITKALR